MSGECDDRTGFNLSRWEELCADPILAKLGYRIETDRHGHIIVTPLPDNLHSNRQSEISFLLHHQWPEGRTQVVAPISTSDGVRVCDVTWASPERYKSIYDNRAHRGAPDICVEVCYPSNTVEEMSDKVALYFDAGTKEVWFCREDGTMEFYCDPEGPAQSKSRLCSELPRTIEA